MVFHKWRTIFVGIAKNASSSIYWSLMNNTDKLCTEHNHNTIFEDIQNNDEDLLNTYTSFAVIRNPYSRFYSAWKHNNPFPGPVSEDEFIYGFNNWVETFSNPNELYDLKNHPHFIPQYKYVSIHNTVVVDKLLRFETLQNDRDSMIKEWNKRDYIPYKKSVALRHENEGYASLDWSNIFTDRSREVVSSYYYRDFELFKYKP